MLLCGRLHVPANEDRSNTVNETGYWNYLETHSSFKLRYPMLHLN
jgi:hypothetical protein